MEELVTNIVNFIETSGLLGVVLSCFILTIESIIPVIPLLVFISVNYLILGPVWGFILSWTFTVLGSILSYWLFKHRYSNKFLEKTKDDELVDKYVKVLRKISTGKMLLIVALPFTPAFAVNIAAGILKIDFKKFFTAIVFGKISLVLYSAYIGTTFVEGVSNPIVLLNLAVIIVLVYILYRIIKKVFKLNI